MRRSEPGGPRPVRMRRHTAEGFGAARPGASADGQGKSPAVPGTGRGSRTADGPRRSRVRRPRRRRLLAQGQRPGASHLAEGDVQRRNLLPWIGPDPSGSRHRSGGREVAAVGDGDACASRSILGRPLRAAYTAALGPGAASEPTPASVPGNDQGGAAPLARGAAEGIGHHLVRSLFGRASRPTLAYEVQLFPIWETCS